MNGTPPDPAPAPRLSRPAAHTIRFVDSHTAGEPTRVVLAGGPPLGAGRVAERCRRFAAEHDRFRSAIVNEPRGSDVLVGALVCPPADPACRIGVIFFNNVGMIGMCGHGTIGLVVSLHAEGLLGPGPCLIETPVGVVTATLHDDGRVSVQNVPSRRVAKDLAVDVPGLGRVRGDVAWGGNWFFLVAEPAWDLDAHSTAELVRIAGDIRRAVNAFHPLVDHVELFGPPRDPRAHSRNFVLCPGGQYDRSPCGTGTSAKLACLAADALLAPGEPWIQESILGTHFTASFAWSDGADDGGATGAEDGGAAGADDGGATDGTRNAVALSAGPTIVPTIIGRASVTARGELVLDPDDPFCWGRRDAP